MAATIISLFNILLTFKSMSSDMQSLHIKETDIKLAVSFDHFRKPYCYTMIFWKVKFVIAQKDVMGKKKKKSQTFRLGLSFGWRRFHLFFFFFPPPYFTTTWQEVDLADFTKTYFLRKPLHHFLKICVQVKQRHAFKFLPLHCDIRLYTSFKNCFKGSRQQI